MPVYNHIHGQCWEALVRRVIFFVCIDRGFSFTLPQARPLKPTNLQSLSTLSAVSIGSQSTQYHWRRIILFISGNYRCWRYLRNAGRKGCVFAWLRVCDSTTTTCAIIFITLEWLRRLLMFCGRSIWDWYLSLTSRAFNMFSPHTLRPPFPSVFSHTAPRKFLSDKSTAVASVDDIVRYKTFPPARR